MPTPRRTSMLPTQVALIIVLAAVIVALTASANGGADVRFKTWNTENGLPQNSVVGIAQTHDGYIWLATFDGLARFDGVRFKIFRKHDTPELPTNRISKLFVDDQGRLWILTEDTTRVVVYEAGRFKSFSKGTDFETADMTEPWRLTKEMVLRNGDAEYVYENGAFVSRQSTARRLPRVFFSEDMVVWIDMGGHYITGREGELAKVLKDTKLPEKLTAGSSVEIDDALWFALPKSKPLTRDQDGSVWPGRYRAASLARIRNGEIEAFPLQISEETAMAVDRNRNLWIGDRASFGLQRIDADTAANATQDNFKFDAVVRDALSVRDVFVDREGNLWVGFETGLQLLRDLAAVKVFTRADGLPSENVYSVYEDSEAGIWFGAWPYDLVRYKNGQFRTERFDLVSALAADRNGRQWAGNSVLKYRDKDGPWQVFDDAYRHLPEPEINVIAEDSAGNLWFGGPKRPIARWDGESLRPFTSSDGLPSDSVTAFLQTRDGTIWIGTINGIARFDGERFATVPTDGTAPAYVRSLYEDSDGTLWIGTYDSGITRFKNGRFVQITTERGLFSNGVFCILEDDEGWFWMNSNQGIYRVRRSDLNDLADGLTASITSASYGPEDGLLNVEGNGGKQPAGMKSSDGRLWFPTAGGLAVVDPKSVHREERAPEVLIEEIKVDQKELSDPANELVMEPGQNALEINYTGISFNNAPTLRFRYRLEGLEKTWTDVGTRRTAYFSHLPYGEYTFRVLAGNRDGVWNERGAGLRVVVQRPFHRTYWFYALVSLLISGIVGLIFYSRVNQLRRIAEAREMYARELLESQERERSRLAMELHDSLGQSLVVIRNRALLGISKKNDDHSMLEQLQEISDASATALQETREIAHTLHPYQIEALGLTTALHSLIDKIEGSSNIGFAAQIDETLADIPHDVAMAVYRIAQEWLTNVVKHSSASGVSVSLCREGSKLMLTITDNGIGFDPQTAKKGLGLKGIAERSRMVGGTLKIESAPGAGAKLRLAVDVA